MANLFSNLFGKKNDDPEPNIDNLNGLFNKSIDEVDDRELAEEVYFHLCHLMTEVDEEEQVALVLGWAKEQQHIFYIAYLSAEVNNGGFNQYYYNFSGNFANYTPEAFKAIGAEKYSDLALAANAVYEAEKDRITETQDGTLEGFSESYEDDVLEVFDEQFYELEEQEDLYRLQAEYIRKNRAILLRCNI